LCEDWPRLVAPLRLCWLKIGVEIEGAEELLRAAEEGIGPAIVN
jgi:hypothetical protein